MSLDPSKNTYIRIQSISEIDPNKLSISMINQKYVDKDNNRYALRFNKETRRIEILKYLLGKGYEPYTPKLETNSSDSLESELESAPQTPLVPKTGIDPRIASAITTQRKSNPTPLPPQNIPVEPSPIVLESKPEPQTPPPPSTHFDSGTLLREDVDLDIFDGKAPNSELNHSSIVDPHYVDAESQNEDSSPPNQEANVPNLNPNDMSTAKTAYQQIEDYIKLLGVYKERMNAIIRNLQNSRIFELTGDPSENRNLVGNFAREMESLVFESIDKMIDLHKEMTSYPRPITYYISKAPLEKREEVKFIESDKEKLKILHLFEMQRHTEAIFVDLKKLTLQLLNILNLKTDTQVKQLQYPNQLMYVDAKNASLYFAQDLDVSMLDIENWKQSP